MASEAKGAAVGLLERRLAAAEAVKAAVYTQESERVQGFVDGLRCALDIVRSAEAAGQRRDDRHGCDANDRLLDGIAWGRS